MLKIYVIIIQIIPYHGIVCDICMELPFYNTCSDITSVLSFPCILVNREGEMQSAKVQ